MERPSTAMSSMPEPPHRTLGHVPVSTWKQTLPVSCLEAHPQPTRWDPAAPERAATVVLYSLHVSALARLLDPTHCQGSGRSHPDELSLVLVAPQCRAILRDASPTGRDG